MQELDLARLGMAEKLKMKSVKPSLKIWIGWFEHWNAVAKLNFAEIKWYPSTLKNLDWPNVFKAETSR